MVYGLLCAVIMAFLLLYVAHRIKLKPQKGFFTNIIDSLVGYVIKLLEGPFGTPEKAAKFAPIFGVFFLFIMLNNLRRY